MILSIFETKFRVEADDIVDVWIIGGSLLYIADIQEMNLVYILKNRWMLILSFMLRLLKNHNLLIYIMTPRDPR